MFDLIENVYDVRQSVDIMRLVLLLFLEQGSIQVERFKVPMANHETAWTE